VIPSILQDARFFTMLYRADCDLAAEVRAASCGICGARLHSAHYWRKPRGGPEGLERDFDRRFSFCCAREGCRSRATPPSVRFLGRRVYLGAVVVLVCAMQSGVTPKRASRLRALLGVDRRTLERWRSWWRESFAGSSFWQGAKAHFVPPLEVGLLPAALLERFAGGGEGARLLALLHFLAPITTEWSELRSS